MGDLAFRILDAMPSKLGASGGFLAMGYATVKPDEASKLLDSFLSADGTQTIGMAGLLLVAVYWLLWFWLKPKNATTADGFSQSTNGANSPAIGSVGPNATINFSSAEPEPRKSSHRYDISGDRLDNLSRALGVAAPKPDITLNGVLVKVYLHLGGSPSDSAEKPGFRKGLDFEIADKVVLENLRTWGRLGNRAISQIPMEAWQRGEFDHRKGTLKSYIGHSEYPTVFGELMFNKEEIAKVWSDD